MDKALRIVIQQNEDGMFVGTLQRIDGLGKWDDVAVVFSRTPQTALTKIMAKTWAFNE